MGGTAAYAALLTCLILWKPLAGDAFVALMDILPIPAELAALTFAIWAARCNTGKGRMGWSLLAVGFGSYACGDIAWTAYEVAFHLEVPTPSVADPFYLAAIPLMLAGIMLLSSARRTLGHLRTAFDATIVLIALTAVVWDRIVAPTLSQAETGLAGTLATVAYPAGDVVLLFAILVALRRQWRGRARIVLVTFAAGLVLLAGSDLGFAAMVLNGTYETGALVDLGWPVGFLLMGLAAAMSAIWSVDLATEEAELSNSALRQLVPMVVAMGLVVWLLVEAITVGVGAHLELAVLAIIAASLAVVRQAVVLEDNLLLNRELARARDELEERVAERTAQLLSSEFRFRSLAQNASDLITVVREDSTIIYQSPSSERILGYAAGELTGKRLLGFLHRADRILLRRFVREVAAARGRQAVLEVRIRHRNGSWHFLEMLGADHRDDSSIGGFVLNARDVTERKLLEERLRHEALHDPLTGLANRALVSDRLAQAIVRARDRGRLTAVLFLDLDDFKSVNDAFGHSAGDALLRSVAARLNETVGPVNTAGRFGGDEFVVLLEDGEDRGWAEDVARALHTALRQPVTVQGKQLLPRLSLGIAIGAGEKDAEELLREADLAMYAAKANGKDRIELYTPQLHDSFRNRLELRDDLQLALANNELFLRFQPIFNLRSGEIAGLEALLRWSHPTRGIVPPGEFIPIAEESGLIADIGRWVLREACAALHRWELRFPERGPMKMNVNVSSRQLFDPTFVPAVLDVLRGTQIEPRQLVLEITESAVIGDAEAAGRVLRRLADLGVQLAIDDFGMGYSSLSYLRDFPFHVLKVDKSFVSAVPAGGDGRALVEAILQMARALHLETVAEGIEETPELRALESLGCDFGQGYLFARPLSPEDVEALLAEPAFAKRQAA